MVVRWWLRISSMSLEMVCMHVCWILSAEWAGYGYTGVTPPIPTVEVTVRSEQFKNESVVVTLEWTVVNGAFMGLSVVPMAATVNLGPSSRQLMLSYNTSYNVTVVARLCGQYSSHSIELHYGELLYTVFIFHLKVTLYSFQLSVFLHSSCWRKLTNH